jgi:hypothetical protein
MELKRYDEDRPCSGPGNGMAECADGDYVRFDDVQPLLERLRQFEQAQADARPVAWMTEDGRRVELDATKQLFPEISREKFSIPLFTAPPAESAGAKMTDEEIFELWCSIPTLGGIDDDIVPFARELLSRTQAVDSVEVHSDDAAVDRFAVAMKQKLAQAREKGRGGWEQCDPVELSIMLREHVEKGDPRDVANFCMFLWNLGKPISDAALPYGKRAIESAGAWLNGQQRDAMQEAIEWAKDEGLPGTAEQLQSILNAVPSVFPAKPGDPTDGEITSTAYKTYGIVADDAEVIAFARWLLSRTHAADGEAGENICAKCGCANDDKCPECAVTFNPRQGGK